MANGVFLSYLESNLPPSQEFASLKGLVAEKSLQAITEMEFTTMTEIQYRTVMPLLAGRYFMKTVYLSSIYDPSGYA